MIQVDVGEQEIIQAVDPQDLQRPQQLIGGGARADVYYERRRSGHDPGADEVIKSV
jgi:hypothetical protein